MTSPRADSPSGYSDRKPTSPAAPDVEGRCRARPGNGEAAHHADAAFRASDALQYERGTERHDFPLVLAHLPIDGAHHAPIGGLPFVIFGGDGFPVRLVGQPFEREGDVFHLENTVAVETLVKLRKAFGQGGFFGSIRHRFRLIFTGEKKVRGVIHCFVEDWETAKQLSEYDFYFGIGGLITYNNTEKLVESVAKIPDNRLLTETDAPFLTPKEYRKNVSKINSPAALPEVVKKIAEIRNMPVEEMAEILYNNAERLFFSK